MIYSVLKTSRIVVLDGKIRGNKPSIFCQKASKHTFLHISAKKKNNDDR